jgi:hypothetical protein
MAACSTSHANAGHRPKQDAADFEEPGAGIEDRTVILLCGRAAEVIGSASTGDFQSTSPRDYESGDQEFESLRARHLAIIQIARIQNKAVTQPTCVSVVSISDETIALPLLGAGVQSTYRSEPGAGR